MTEFSEKDIKERVSRLICEWMDAGKVLDLHWLTTGVLNEHGDISGSDAEFYVLCARQHIHRLVKQQVQKLENDMPGTQQGEFDAKGFLLEGYQYLRRGYSMKRDGTLSLVPIFQCTDEELIARANEYFAMAEGNNAHGTEILRFIADRKSAGVPEKAGLDAQNRA